MLVFKDATVRLIDCDSFQVQDKSRLLPCGVGVPEFIPPELQGKDAGSVTRDVEHDRFGLAMLTFFLLMMGRNPYAGVYRGAGGDDSGAGGPRKALCLWRAP